MNFNSTSASDLVRLNEPLQLHWFARLALLIIGMSMLALLVTAFMLEPNAQGMGTHQQLGLAPCSFVQWFGMRCPSCGMTTSWAHITKGQWPSAVAANFSGTLLAMVSVFLAPWFVATSLRGYWIGRPPNDWYVVIGSLGWLGITVVEWLIRISLV